LTPRHAPLVVAALLAVGLFALPAAAAQNRKPSRSHPAARGLRAELRAAQATLARATEQLAGIRSRIAAGGLQRPLLGLRRTLKRAKAQLRAAARLDTSPLTVAVQQVRREVAYVRGGVPRYSRSQLISQAAMDYVAGHVSVTAFGYLKWFGKRLPKVAANSALHTQAGICAQAAVSFAAIVHRFGLRVRSVNFNYLNPQPNETPDGHIAVEVLYDGSWHFFDPTYGLFWTDPAGRVLSIGDVRAGLGTLQKNVASFTNVFEDAVLGDGTWFETDPATGVVLGFTKLIH